MKNELRRIHRKVRRCNRCEDFLKNKVLPRSGFPPRDIYKAIIIGAEPGPKAKTLMTPTEYEKHFMPGTKNTNRVRLLFEDLSHDKRGSQAKCLIFCIKGSKNGCFLVLNMPFWAQNCWSKEFLKNTIWLKRSFLGSKSVV
jgi:hypothetical protein